MPRCCSLESPKKLRFAVHHDDGTPARRRPSGVAEEDEYSCCDRHLSVSCPCIDHIDPASAAAAGAGGILAAVAAATSAFALSSAAEPKTAGAAGAAGRARFAADTLHAPPVRVAGFPRVNSAPVTPMAADCVDMTAASMMMAAGSDDVNEPLLLQHPADGAITFV